MSGEHNQLLYSALFNKFNGEIEGNLQCIRPRNILFEVSFNNQILFQYIITETRLVSVFILLGSRASGEGIIRCRFPMAGSRPNFKSVYAR